MRRLKIAQAPQVAHTLFICYNYLMEGMIHKGTQVIFTERLILRRFTLADTAPAFENWMSDEKVTPFLTWQPYTTLSATRGTLARWISAYDNDEFYLWAITLKANSLPIGSIDARIIDEKAGYMRIGYCLGSKWWCQGIMTEALRAVIKFLFDEVRASRIEARHAPANPASGEVMKKCGMRYEATLKNAAWCNIGVYDTIIYSILRTDRPADGD